MRVLVTGASGFVAGALLPRLAREAGVRLRVASRRPLASGRLALAPGCEPIVVGELDAFTDWRAALEGVDAVVHLAARAHEVREGAAEALEAHRRVNIDGTARLVQAAAAAGVSRFVLLSTVKVHGDAGAFRETDTPQPRGAYAASKLEAERAVRAAAALGAMQAVIVRPPLVHGPGARANLGALVRAVARGVPLPLGGVDNRRSLVGASNLADALAVALTHARAAEGDGTFLVSDGEDVSTPELVRRIAAALGRRARLVPVPSALLALAGRAVGRGAAVERLLGSLTVDITRARERLGWRPPVSLDEGLRAMVQGVR